MDHEKNSRGFFASRANVVLLVFLGVGGFYLVSEHRAHLIGAVPLLLAFGLCLGMHFFMHGGHGKHKSVHDEEDAQPGGGKKPGGHGH
ncbi:hypothetical protein GCM10007989_23920 [Devosia pacifica]|uniref:DUF2933 domain-containing protein n=2 Tax=Devosia pacifica TaxID=1335967 RepID=A0A918S6S5_9HYPH|nr:hypothetical protein GCM10007989_23920 [Devosia pacifica]